MKKRGFLLFFSLGDQDDHGVLNMGSRNPIEAFYRIFRDISSSVHSSTDVDEVLDLVVRKVTEALEAKGALLRILNLETEELELSATYGLSKRYLSKGHVSSKKVITELCKENKPIIIEDVLKDPRVQYPKEARDEGIRMMLDIPLLLGNDVVAVLRIFFAETRKFSEEELDLAASIAEQCACAIDKARLIEKQRDQYDHLAIQTEKLSSLGRLAAGVAHEINNPLAGILLYSTNLLKKVPDAGPLKEGLDIIIHETIRCRGIIQELLEFSREQEPNKVVTNINDIIEKALSILENEFRLHRIHVEKRLSTDIPDMSLDVNQMEQVFVNFLLNAIEAIQGEGLVTIRSRIEPDIKKVTIEIKDNGAGIPKEHMDRIFEPFFSTKPKGTGLGLAVNFGIIEKHQGQIEISSQSGQGTRVAVKLPYP